MADRFPIPLPPDAPDAVELADSWFGEGVDLAQRMIALLEVLRLADTSPSAVRHPEAAVAFQECADRLEQVLRREWDPLTEVAPT